MSPSKSSLPLSHHNPRPSHALLGALVYAWAWFFFAPVRRKRLTHPHPNPLHPRHYARRRVLRRTYQLDELRVTSGTLSVRRPLHAQHITISGSGPKPVTLQLHSCVDVGDLHTSHTLSSSHNFAS